MSELEIINNLKKEVCDIRIDVQKSFSGYKQKEINLWYSVKNSLLSKENKESRNENNFYYKDNEEKIDKLMKKGEMGLFEFLAEKHLEKNQGYGETPKQFQAPCYKCNQKTLTTLWWSEEGYPGNLERFYCRLCRTSFSSWIDIKDDPRELQLEMRGYYLDFAKKELEKEEKELKNLTEKQDKIKQNLKLRQQFITESKEFIKTCQK